MRRFAFDFCHGQLWGGGRFPQVHAARAGMVTPYLLSGTAGTRNSLTTVFRPLTFVALRTSGSGDTAGVAVDRSYRSRTVSKLEPLAAVPSYLVCDGVPKEARARLVVAATTSPREPRPEVWIALDRPGFGAGYGTPFSGTPSEFRRFPQTGAETECIVVDDLGEAGTPTLATVIAFNPDLARSSGFVEVARWLLEPPEYVEASRQRDDTFDWDISWPESEFAAHLEAFETYRVYRKPRGAPDEAYEAVLDTRENFVVHRAPDVASYDFTVRVVDRLGNESKNAWNEAGSFVGTWDGKMRMLDGNPVQAMTAFIDREHREDVAESRAEIARASDSGRRARLQQELAEDEANWRKARSLFDEALAPVEALLRLGIPMSVEIREVDTRLELRLVSVGGTPYEADDGADWLPMRRVSPHRIAPRPDPGEEIEFELPELRMHRLDPEGRRAAVMRCNEWEIDVPIDEDDPESERVRARLAFEFTRRSEDDAD